MILQEGSGWRLAVDASRKSFPVLLGGENWAIELTHHEWKALLPIIDELIGELKKLENQLMPEELICLEMEKKPWWVCLDGEWQSWNLQIVIDGDGQSIRGAEAFWPTPASQSIVCAMRTIWDSSK